MDASAPPQRHSRRWKGVAVANHAHHHTSAATLRFVDVIVAPDGWHASKSASANGRGLDSTERGFVLSGFVGRRRSVAIATRGGRCGVGGARDYNFRQFWWLAGAADPVGRAAYTHSASLPHGLVRGGGCGPLVAGTPDRHRVRWRCRRACRAHAAGPVRRGVLAAHRTRGGMVAAMAGTVACFSQAREPRRDPWRAFRRWVFRRAVCAARRHWHAARNSTTTGCRYLARRVGFGPAESCGHSNARAEDYFAGGQPGALSGWRTDGFVVGGRSDLFQRTRSGHRMASPSGLVTRASTGTVICSGDGCHNR